MIPYGEADAIVVRSAVLDSVSMVFRGAAGWGMAAMTARVEDHLKAGPQA